MKRVVLSSDESDEDVPAPSKQSGLASQVQVVPNTRVNIWWSGNNRWFVGTILRQVDGKHIIRYDDGEVKAHEMHEEIWEAVARAQPAPQRQAHNTAVSKKGAPARSGPSNSPCLLLQRGGRKRSRTVGVSGDSRKQLQTSAKGAAIDIRTRLPETGKGPSGDNRKRQETGKKVIVIDEDDEDDADSGGDDDEDDDNDDTDDGELEADVDSLDGHQRSPPRSRPARAAAVAAAVAVKQLKTADCDGLGRLADSDDEDEDSDEVDGNDEKPSMPEVGRNRKSIQKPKAPMRGSKQLQGAVGNVIVLDDDEEAEESAQDVEEPDDVCWTCFEEGELICCDGDGCEAQHKLTPTQPLEPIPLHPTRPHPIPLHPAPPHFTLPYHAPPHPARPHFVSRHSITPSVSASTACLMASGCA